MENKPTDDLMISGLKHFAFCRRRWALIHIEQLWCENALTQEGHYLHERVHDPNFTQLRGSVLLSRAMPVRSEALHITGECDMVELHRDPNGVPIHGRTGLWRLYPVEYKHGKPDARGADELQLCAQAMCLEEMLCCTIPAGAIYYGEPRRREQVVFTEELRAEVRAALTEMHQYVQRGYTPKVKPRKGCGACSLQDVCLPKLMGKSSVEDYVKEAVEG